MKTVAKSQANSQTKYQTKYQLPFELWGGVECTVNRVGDRFFDQLDRTGHTSRLDDLDRFANLGITAIRYPILWEHVAPIGLDTADWTWADERLDRLRQLNIRPVVGLVHHGSGPQHTNLLDPAFPKELAAYARAVAERYPWITDYTPVNEPLTTARFSALYGHWYPHARDPQAFVRALLIQCRAIVLAMRAIREVNPSAQLIQTDDLGKIYSTPTMAYQADHENERRWLSFDLLCGRVHEHHPMRSFMYSVGIAPAEIDWFLDNFCPPDIIGINYYLTSERFLDERTELYPGIPAGGNGRHSYVDVEAVRVRADGLDGAEIHLREAWERYKLPIAVTEVHNGCTREEQLRWFAEVWQAAEKLKQAGVDLRAVTAWSLLGTYDWDSLVTQDNGRYEPGVFDIRSSAPRPTIIAKMLRKLATEGRADHPVLTAPGWWRRPERLLYGFAVQDRSNDLQTPTKSSTSYLPSRPILITGATGTLGRAIARICERRGLPYQLLNRAELDIADPVSVEKVLDTYQPWAVINAAGYVRVDAAEYQWEACLRENTIGPRVLAAACNRRNIQFVTFSSDLVFDGGKHDPYIESDAPKPLCMYGKSKAVAEKAVLRIMPNALVIRSSAFFGPWDEHNFVTQAIRTIKTGDVFIAATDAKVSPTYVPDLVHGCLDLLIDGEHGIWHLANQGEITWFELAQHAVEYAGLDAHRVEGRLTHELGLVAPRPHYSVLSSERGLLLPSLEHALKHYMSEKPYEKVS